MPALTAEQVATKITTLNATYDAVSAKLVTAFTVAQTNAIMQKLKDIREEIVFWENRSVLVENNYQNSALINLRGPGRS